MAHLVINKKKLRASKSAICDYEAGLRPLHALKMKHFLKVSPSFAQYPLKFLKAIAIKYCRANAHHLGGYKHSMYMVQFYDLKLLQELGSDTINSDFKTFQKFGDLKLHK